jgi:hypothetical protein
MNVVLIDTKVVTPCQPLTPGEVEIKTPTTAPTPAPAPVVSNRSTFTSTTYPSTTVRCRWQPTTNGPCFFLDVTTFHTPGSHEQWRTSQAELQRITNHGVVASVSTKVWIGDGNWHHIPANFRQACCNSIQASGGRLLAPTHSTTNAMTDPTTKPKSRQPADIGMVWPGTGTLILNPQTEVVWLQTGKQNHKGLRQKFGCTDHQPVFFRFQLTTTQLHDDVKI